MSTVPAETVAAVRRFNRFYTGLVGVLDEGYLATSFSLAEGRVVYELAHHDAPTATEVGRALRLDAGYLSRILRRLEQDGLLAREASPTDGRRHHLRLTDTGRAAAAELDARARDDVAGHVAALAPADRDRLLIAMRTIERLLTAPAEVPNVTPPGVVLREPRPGDYGWVIARNGAVYAAEYGWDLSYEALVARIVAEYAASHDPGVEHCWIAERDGENVGCIFCVKHPERAGVAKLRLLLVEPSARGLGVGWTLVGACVAFARAAGYHTMTLWTQSCLGAARRIYQAAGFRLADERPNVMFGADLVSQTWELDLRETTPGRS